MNKLLDLLNLMLKQGAMLGAYFSGVKHEQNRENEARADSAEKDAAAWADKPRSYDEFAERMRAKAKADHDKNGA